jgi:hypothetical protein
VAALTRDGCSCRRQLIGLAIYATADANIATDMPYKKRFILIKTPYIFYIATILKELKMNHGFAVT